MTQSMNEEWDYTSLNALINLYDRDGNLQVDKDKDAARAYFLQYVNKNTQYFHDLEEKIHYLTENNYWDKELFTKYSTDDVKALFKQAYDHKYRFPTFMGALKFYSSYALKSDDGTTILERYEDRIVLTALKLADGDAKLASKMVEEIITNRYQPATPTFQNAGKARGGEQVSCFLLRVEDDLDSITEAWNSAAQLSKIGGGVAINFSNLRELGAPLKGKRGLAKGIVPWMKVFEDIFSAVDQLGTRPGAGAVYLSAHHPQIMQFLDTKKENADEKTRIKSLSIGVVIPDVTMQLAKTGSDMYLFSPYDVKKEYGIDFSDLNVTEMYDELVDNPRIHKSKIKARELLTRMAQMQFESGYPYVLFSDTANKANPIDGVINMSNLCSEILQTNTPTKRDEKTGRVTTLGQDISCNLGSLNVLKALEGKNLEETVNVAMRALTAVADQTSIDRVPSIKKANDNMHSVGLGQMNLAGLFAYEEMMYGDEDSLAFTNGYFMAINYYSLKASMEIAKERGGTFKGFKKSKYADGSYFDAFSEEDFKVKSSKAKKIFKKYNVTLPTYEDFMKLKEEIMENGLWHSYRQAIPPTGSISYIAQSTSSIHPIVSPIEIRKEKLGRVYVPMPNLDERTMPYYIDAFTLGPEPLIDVYSEATRWIDQGLSLTVFLKDSASTKDATRAMSYAYKKGIKTLYYYRIRQTDLAGTEVDGCVSCAL